TPLDAVYRQIKIDLRDAQKLLPEDFEAYNGQRVRPNKWSASALLARVSLYLEEWRDAEAAATDIINQTLLFELMPDVNDVFKANSNEAIWQLLPVRSNANT